MNHNPFPDNTTASYVLGTGIGIAGVLAHRHHEQVPQEGDASLSASEEMKAMTGGRVLAVMFPYLKPLGSYTEQERREYAAMKDCLGKAGNEYLGHPASMRTGMVSLRSAILRAARSILTRPPIR